MPKSDFNKVTKQLYWNHSLAWVLSCKFAAYSQQTFSYEHLLRAASGSYNAYDYQREYFRLFSNKMLLSCSETEQKSFRITLKILFRANKIISDN